VYWSSGAAGRKYSPKSQTDFPGGFAIYRVDLDAALWVGVEQHRKSTAAPRKSRLRAPQSVSIRKRNARGTSQDRASTFLRRAFVMREDSSPDRAKNF
jgi:hypothetical protein